MKHSETKKQMAQELYVLGNQTQKGIGELMGINENTIGKWVKENGWEDLRNLRSITKAQLLQDSYAQLKAVNDMIKSIGNVPTKELYDAKSILGKEIDRLSDSPLAVYTDVLSAFVDWILRNEPKHTELFAKLSMQFIEQKNR